MSEPNYPIPPSHRTFNFGAVRIDSNFDSGNCSDVVKISNTSYEIWIGIDHPNNKYRTWFHFSIEGLNKGTTVSFKIKNQQNQSRLLNQGLVPVYRQESSNDWKRIRERINLSNIEYNEGWIQWTFRHTMTSDEKVYLAFFYPWSNIENANLLTSLRQKTKQNPNIYYHRTTIARTIQGRPIEFVVISSNKGKMGKEEKIQDKNLFIDGKKPALFQQGKPVIVIGARVHPGQVPGSHVMTGILKQLTEDNEKMKILRDKFVFYIFPIFNPDGVARGHYRVDTNGINLNRCYINPSIKSHPSIYAVRKIIMHLHENNKFFAFLDLHAHAARKGTFIYGNWSNQLKKQVDACLFPKILSMNSIDFEYQGSNFTQKNMNCKDRGDHMSKQGSGRVAMFKATKNANCWTLQCNYNMSKVHNILEPEKNPQDIVNKPTQDKLDLELITQFKNMSKKQPKQFFTIQVYHKLGKEICESFLDLAQMNPYSRIENPKNYFKSVQNLKMNLAVALLRMAPTRFQTQFKKIYNAFNNVDNKQVAQRAFKALYLLIIKNAKIQNINGFLKEGDRSSIVLEEQKKPKSVSPVKRKPPNFSSLLERNSSNNLKNENEATQNNTLSPLKSRRLGNSHQIKVNKPGAVQAMRDNDLYRSTGSLQSDDSSNISPIKVLEDERMASLLEEKLKIYHQNQKKDRNPCAKVNLRLEEVNLFGPNRKNMNEETKRNIRIPSGTKMNNIRFKIEELPLISKKTSMNMGKIDHDQIPLRKGTSAKEHKGIFFY